MTATAVPSRSVPGRIYTVTDGRCNCPSGTYRHTCRHVREVEDQHRADRELFERARRALREEPTMGFKMDGVQVKDDGVPVGVYQGRILAVSNPETKPDPFNEGRSKTQFHIEFALTGGDLERETEQWMWVSVPPKLLSERYLSPKSTLHGVLVALGYDPDPDNPFRINSDEWLNKLVQVVIEPKEDGKGTKVTKLLPPTKQMLAAGSQGAAPVSNGNGRAASGGPPWADKLVSELGKAGLALLDLGPVVGDPPSWKKVTAWVEEFTQAFPEEEWMAALIAKAGDANVPPPTDPDDLPFE